VVLFLYYNQVELICVDLIFQCLLTSHGFMSRKANSLQDGRGKKAAEVPRFLKYSILLSIPK